MVKRLNLIFLLQVLLAKQKSDSKVFAVKVLQKAAIMKRNEVKHIMAERNVLLKNVSHPFLVGLHYSFQTADKLYFVLDYVNGGEVGSEYLYIAQAILVHTMTSISHCIFSFSSIYKESVPSQNPGLSFMVLR